MTFLSSDSRGVLSGYPKVSWKAEKPYAPSLGGSPIDLHIPQANSHSPLMTTYNLRGYRGAQVVSPHDNLVSGLMERWLAPLPHCHKDQDEVT